jgi:hypothetical protein
MMIRYEDADLVYTASCGCQVKFFQESGWHTRMLAPAPACLTHTPKDQFENRDKLMEEAKEAVKRKLGLGNG